MKSVYNNIKDTPLRFTAIVQNNMYLIRSRDAAGHIGIVTSTGNVVIVYAPTYGVYPVGTELNKCFSQVLEYTLLPPGEQVILEQ